jgi:hypothetical protein
MEGVRSVADFAGEFETHITVRADTPNRLDALQDWADEHGLKFHYIVLDRGLTPMQPMVTRKGQGDLNGEMAAAGKLSARLVAKGFDVTRMKVEAAPGNIGIPETDGDALRHGGRYFEQHIKLLFDPDTNTESVTAIAAAYRARLSRNARRVRVDGRSERFVTQRCHAVGRMTARNRLDSLVAALLTGGYSILSIEEEYVVLDTAPGVDAGWIDHGGVA